LRRSRVDIIGPAGTPDGGFEVGNPVVATNGAIDFTLGAGAFYLGGHRLDLEQDETFQLQSDWLDMDHDDADQTPQPPSDTDSRFDLVYLECWQQPVSAVED